MNLQRSICLAAVWLAHPSRASFLRVIELSEYDGKTRFVWKNHIAKLSATHPLNLQRSICLASLWLVHPSRARFLSVIEPSEHKMAALALWRKIKFQSCLPLTPWTCKDRFVQRHYDLYIVQEHISLVLLNAPHIMVRLALCSKITLQSCLPLISWTCKGRFF